MKGYSTMKYDFELIPVPADALEAVGIIPGVMAEACFKAAGWC